MPEWIGQTIGKVRIEKYLARGGMAEVYLGTHITLNRQVAVKVLHSYIEEDPMVLERFQREARVVAAMRHSNIVQIYDFDTIDGHPYIVMEYLKGPTLKAYLQHQRKTRIPHLQVARLLNELAAALGYAHKQGVIHRDIKPGNILLHDEIPLDEPLPEDVEAVLTDFGLVRLADTSMHTTSGVISGTPEYMSPEQALGSEIDHRTDIYSVGIVLYEMLAGRVPFKADNILTVLSMQIHETPPPVPELPARVQAVLDRALQKNPEDRHQSSLELAVDFSGSIGLGAEPVKLQEPEPGPLVPAPPPIQTRAPFEHSGVTSSVFQAWRERVEREIEQHEDLPEEDKALLKQNVEQITREAEKGKKTDTKRIERLLSMLSVRAPDILDVALPTLTDLHVNIEGSDNVVAIRGIATSFKIVLQNSRPIVTLLLGLVLIGGAIAFLYWMSLQPGRMTGDFNIAVAEFMQVGDSEPKVASILSQTVYQFIDQEFNSPQYNIDIDVEHKNIGVISGEDRAEELAQSINADIIIYGTVQVINENVIISPRFYIANSIRADAGELIGFHLLEVPQELRVKDLPNLLIEGTEEREKLLHNSEILIYFTQGLTYLVLPENEEVGRESYLRLAFESIQKAIDSSDELKAKTGLEAGNEVLYLFASHISLLRGNQESAKTYIDETLLINDCYGRAYIAQGNVLYDMGVSAHARGDSIFQDYFDQAINSYNHALELDSNRSDCGGQPYGYYLPVKAHTGLGNTYSFLFQVGPDAMNTTLAEKALSSFEQVVSAQNHLPKDDPSRDLLTKLAANAQYQSGVIFLIQEKKEQAIGKFQQVIQLEDCTPLANKARDQLERLGEAVPGSCGEQNDKENVYSRSLVFHVVAACLFTSMFEFPRCCSATRSKWRN